MTCSVISNLDHLSDKYEIFGIGVNQLNGSKNIHERDVSFPIYSLDSKRQTWYSNDDENNAYSIFYSDNENIEFQGLLVNDLECWEIFISSSNKIRPIGVKVKHSDNNSKTVLVSGTIQYLSESDTIIKNKNSKTKNFFYL